MTTFITLALFAPAEEGGFNPLDLSQGGGLFWTVVIFAIALVPIWKLVMGPITKGLTERDERVNAAVLAAAQASKDAESAKLAVQQQLSLAQLEASKLVEAARARAEAVERSLKDDASKQAAALLDRARTEIQAEQEKAIAAIRREVVDVTMQAAGAVLSRKVDATDDRRLVEELVGAAGSSKKGPRS